MLDSCISSRTRSPRKHRTAALAGKDSKLVKIEGLKLTKPQLEAYVDVTVLSLIWTYGKMVSKLEHICTIIFHLHAQAIVENYKP